MFENNTVIFIVGHTGDGKSAVGNGIMKNCGRTTNCFQESPAAVAQTRYSEFATQGDVTVVDNPGLGDTDGAAQDNINIDTIVAKAQEIGHFEMLLLALNAATPRFDDCTQASLKRIVDTFRKDCLNHLFVVYTRGLDGDETNLTVRTEEIRRIINAQCQASLDHLTFYVVENYPDNPNVMPAVSASFRTNTQRTYTQLVMAARAQPKYSTLGAVAARTALVQEEERLRREVEETQRRTAAAQVQQASLQQQVSSAQAGGGPSIVQKAATTATAATVGACVGGPVGAVVGGVVGAVFGGGGKGCVVM